VRWCELLCHFHLTSICVDYAKIFVSLYCNFRDASGGLKHCILAADSTSVVTVSIFAQLCVVFELSLKFSRVISVDDE